MVQGLRGLAFEVIGERMRAITGSRASLQDFAQPPGDPGVFGPASMAWRVHAHFTAMMVGGLSSLMVQALHPRALAAVWDHSNFRHDLRGRLGRTAFFVAATTYGGRALALRTIERVNAIHAKAMGTDLQGRSYVANEPHLIRWVHLVEVSSFLTAYQHLSSHPLSPAQCDQYTAEMRQIGEGLGATDLPQSLKATELALLDFQAELAWDDRARETVQCIETYPTDLLDKPFMALVVQAAFDVMPEWALDQMGRARACALQRHTHRLALQAAAAPVQWMLQEQGVSAIARQRVQAVAPMGQGGHMATAP
jgi:uncharacterized protein (DUF2236 family)